MKRFLVFSMLLFAVTVKAQEDTVWMVEDPDPPVGKPYINVGTSLSAGTFSYGGEVGVYYDRMWFSLAYFQYKDDGVQKWAAFRTYYRYRTVGAVDNYVWLGTNVHLARDRTVIAEPGLASVFNISDKIAPQLSISFPIGNTVYPSFGLSINYWIK